MDSFSNNKILQQISDYTEPSLGNYIETLESLFKNEDDTFPAVLQLAEDIIALGALPDDKLKLYELAGDYYYLKNQLDLSVLYYLMAFEVTNKVNPSSFTAMLANKICRSYYNMNKFQDALYYISFALNYIDGLSKDDIIKLTFNCALCYKNIGLYKEALDELLKLDKLIGNSENPKYFDIITLESNCYIKLELYSKAIEKYLELLKTIEGDVIKQVISMLNLAQAYIYAGEELAAEKCISQIKLLMKHLSPRTPYKLKIYTDLAKVYLCLNNMNEAKKYLMRAHKLAKESKNITQQKEILNHMFTVCDKNQSLSLAGFIKDQMLYIIDMNYENSGWLLIFQLLNFYNKLGKNHQVNEILTVILNIK